MESEIWKRSGWCFCCFMLLISIFLLLQGILLLLMLFMRKRVALTIALFHVAGKVFIHLPLLALQPFCTFLALFLFWIYWIMVLLFLGTTGEMKIPVGLKKKELLSSDTSHNFFPNCICSRIVDQSLLSNVWRKTAFILFNFFILFYWRKSHDLMMGKLCQTSHYFWLK